MAGRLIVMSGASGAGKTSVATRLLEDARFVRAVTATTRAPRAADMRLARTPPEPAPITNRS